MQTLSFIPALLMLSACAFGGADDAEQADLQASCEALVGAETDTGPSGVKAISTQSDPTGSVTSVFVAGAEAPWLCRADATGVVTGVEYSREG
ncbi:hypothetical protein SAMN05444358_107115 [Ruegeria halocynthiae]|uniref:Lipoprotein n=1 Tax=Ruegeria halocynthiae TaxID=985054 RepID=A0A1H3CRX6_9RHOB|nr:hypothetical protein [Ruegeria halocynthiae]SDX56992.1 hypothetical protein SAMN05444358_107115 [Ruegeria halocynthiae]